jgi:hypothetical protein
MTRLFAKVKFLRELFGSAFDFTSAVTNLQDPLADLSLSNAAFQVASTLKEVFERNRSMRLGLMDDRSFLGNLFDGDGGMDARAIDSWESHKQNRT